MPHRAPKRNGKVLILGASGYIGGRLLPRLLDSGYAVRAAVRTPEKLQCRPYAQHPRLEIVQADLFDRESLGQAMRSCRAAFYLVHSMQSGTKRFADRDRQAAINAREAAAEAGLERIIYLGGLGEDGDDLSEHLRSRREVGQILSGGSVPVTWLRAAVILGAGSASFEMIRYLTERLPVMLTPRWIRTQSQPIAVSNVLGYLQGCLESEETAGRALDICGPNLVSYKQLMHMYAEAVGLPRRLIIPLPVLTPRLSAYWIHLVTPVPASLARPLAEGLRNRAVCMESSIRGLVPQQLLSCRQAIGRALETIQRQQVETCWSDAGSLRAPEWMSCGDPDYAGGTIFRSSYRAVLPCRPETVWPIVANLGGSRGWLFANPLWRLRGLVDRLIGGPGLRRGRRDHDTLRNGDALDFWRVLQVDAPTKLTLLAEMKLPGQAFLDFELRSPEPGKTELSLIAGFLPKGLFGLLYWWALYPMHRLIFPRLVQGIADAAGTRCLLGPEPFDPFSEGQACRISREP